MKVRNPLALNHSLSFILQTGKNGSGEPYAARVALNRLSLYLIGATVAYAFTVMGTLLFFRELEINRKLQEHVLKLESEKRLYQSYPLPDRLLSSAPTTATAEETGNSPSTRVARHERTVAHAAPVEKPKVEGAVADAIVARINDLRVECAEDNCSIRLGMVTSQPGTAVGRLLLVLETEVPRIGGANPSTPLRKRYFFYPGNSARDEMDPNQLGTLEQKAFRFNRVLQTNTVFKMGKLLRPLAINAYVFDSEKQLLQHERKVIESEEQ